MTRIYERAEPWFWALLILLLPITSLPALSKIAGGTMVAPASAIPMALIVGLYTLPRLLRGAALPRQVLPVLGLVLAALLSTAAGLFIETPLFRDVNRIRNALSALLTLAIGVGFFLAAVTSFRSLQRLRWLQAWLNASGLILILWSAAQFAAWRLLGAYPHWMEQIQNLISVSGNLYDRRMTGLAFEPSWLGHQLVMLYLPYWLAASMTRTSAFSKKFLGLSVENALLVSGVGVLLLSFARSALASFLLAVGLVCIVYARRAVAWLRMRISAARQRTGKRAIPARLISAAIWVSVLVILITAAFGGLYFLSRFDARMENLFSLLSQPLSFEELATKLIFGERVAFWQTGLAVFSDYPVLGVGLDSAGFYFTEKMTPQAWSMVEPHKLYYSTSLPNPLSLWVRLLAETGMLGFGIFVSFLILMALTAAVLVRHSDAAIRTLALTGAFTLVSLLMEGLSVDTFAFPYYWISFGWLTAAFQFTRQPKAGSIDPLPVSDRSMKAANRA